jgi:hypothetical protein
VGEDVDVQFFFDELDVFVVDAKEGNKAVGVVHDQPAGGQLVFQAIVLSVYPL